MTSRRRAPRLVALLGALVLGVIFPATALAHAELVRAIPADGETVTEPVTVLSGRYSEDLTGNSNLRVLDAGGETVATGRIDPENPRRMIARPDAPLLDGTYTVQSLTISAADGDPDRTTWTFTVEIAASPSPPPEPSPTASAAPSASPSAEPTTAPSASPSAASAAPTPAPSTDPGTPTSGTGDVLLPILAALAIVGVGAGFLLRRGRGPTA